MAPQESNVVVGTKRSSQIKELFSFPFPKKRKQNRKKKQTSTSGHESPNDQPQKSPAAIEVITLDSDDSHDKFEKSDDDVIVLENPINEIEHIDRKNDELDACKLKEDNIVINIDQPVHVDYILQSETRVLNGPGINALLPIRQESDSDLLRLKPVIDNPKAWTKDMIDYYTRPCERYRNFDYKEVLKTIQSKPSDWYINAADRYGIPQKKKYLPCRKCHKGGHIEKECRKNVVCYICGEFNHIYLRCPNTLCLTCGKSTSKTINSCINCQNFVSTKQSCALCGQMYHSEKMCPSKWRQYLILDDSNVPAKPNPRKFCYNCAGKGHFGFECPLTPYSEYPPENPIITSLINRPSPSNRSADDNNNCKNAVIYLYQDTTDRLKTEAGSKFLKNFSDTYKVYVELFHSPRNYIKIFGRREEIDAFRRHLNEWKKEVAGAILV